MNRNTFTTALSGQVEQGKESVQESAGNSVIKLFDRKLRKTNHKRDIAMLQISNPI